MKNFLKISVVVLIATGSVFSQIPINGLVSYFPFNGNPQDLFENLSLDTVPTFVKSPVITDDHFNIIKSAYNFNGSTQAFKAIETSALPSGNQNLTVNAWIRKSVGGAQRVITSWGTDSNNQAKKFTFFTSSNANVTEYFLGVTNGVDSLVYKVPTLSVLTNWAYVAVVLKNDTAKLYINGVKKSEKYMIFDIQPNSIFGLGADWKDSRTATNFYCGGIDDIAIYKKAFNDNEIDYMFHCKSSINSLPQITSSPVKTTFALRLYSYDVVTKDGSGHDVIVSILEKPEGMTISGNKISWTPTNAQVGKNKTVIVAKDVAGDSITQSFEITVEASLSNPPVITSTPNVLARTNVLYSYSVITSTSNQEKESITISLKEKPAGMTLSGNNISWTPTNVQIGKNKVRLMVKNNFEDSTEQAFEISVEPTTGISKIVTPHNLIPSQNIVYFLPNGKICQKIPTTKGLIVSKNVKRLIIK